MCQLRLLNYIKKNPSQINAHQIDENIRLCDAVERDLHNFLEIPKDERIQYLALKIAVYLNKQRTLSKSGNLKQEFYLYRKKLDDLIEIHIIAQSIHQLVKHLDPLKRKHIEVGLKLNRLISKACECYTRGLSDISHNSQLFFIDDIEKLRGQLVIRKSIKYHIKTSIFRQNATPSRLLPLFDSTLESFTVV